MKFVVFALAVVGALSFKAYGDVGGDLSTQYYENLSNHPNPGIQITPDIHYDLDNDTKIRAEIPYRSTVGWEDTILALSHKTSKHVEFYLNGFLPTSLKSQADSLYGGGSGNMVLSADLGPLSLKFDNGLMGWYYQYDTQANGHDFNSAFALSDKITAALKLISTLKLMTTFHLYTFQDFNGQTNNIYRDSVGLNYAPSKTLSFDLFYAYKSGDLNDITSLQGGHYQVHAGFAVHI